MKITYAIALAAGRDAANARAARYGRTTWNAADYNAAARLVAKLMALAS